MARSNWSAALTPCRFMDDRNKHESMARNVEQCLVTAEALHELFDPSDKQLEPGGGTIRREAAPGGQRVTAYASRNCPSQANTCRIEYQGDVYFSISGRGGGARRVAC